MLEQRTLRRSFTHRRAASTLDVVLAPSSTLFAATFRKARRRLKQDLEGESRGAAGRKQMARLPEVCVRGSQIRCFGLAEAKRFELIDPPQEALVVRTRLESLTTQCSAVPHISPRRVDDALPAP